MSIPNATARHTTPQTPSNELPQASGKKAVSAEPKALTEEFWEGHFRQPVHHEVSSAFATLKDALPKRSRDRHDDIHIGYLIDLRLIDESEATWGDLETAYIRAIQYTEVSKPTDILGAPNVVYELAQALVKAMETHAAENA